MRPQLNTMIDIVVKVVAFTSLLTNVAAADDVASTIAFPLDTGVYGAFDDASWAVKSTNLTSVEKKVLYVEYMEGCRKACFKEDKDEEWNLKRADNVCDSSEAARLSMNRDQPPSMLNYTKLGFQKIRSPPEVMELINNFWSTNRENSVVEWKQPTPYHNNWDVPPTILRIDNSSLPDGGPKLQAAIANAARDAMEAWTGIPQTSSSVYGIRIYHRGSILSPHVDRLPLVSSCIINVAQDVEEDWMLEVYDHDGNAHNITMTPGDMVLYESHSVIHGRPFPLNGNFYANVFVHFEPLKAPMNSDIELSKDLPPYIIRGSEWEEKWRGEYPNGWNLLKNPIDLVKKGDLPTLRLLHATDPSSLREHDGTDAEWQPIHEAMRFLVLDVVKFLVEEAGIGVNTKCRVGTNIGTTPLGIALNNADGDETNDVVQYLIANGAERDASKVPFPKDSPSESMDEL